MNPKQEMTVEEVKKFFSATAEYEVEDLDPKGKQPYIKITFTDESPRYVHKCSDTLWGTLNVQQLIRTIRKLSFNMDNKIFD